MRNPLKDEETAFRVVLGTIAYLALIVLASWLATWLGVVVFIVLTAVAVWILRGGKRTEPAPQHHIERAGVDDTLRILVVANETVGDTALRDLLRTKAEGERRTCSSCAPRSTRRCARGHLDEDGARAAAEARLRSSLEALTAAGVTVRGEIGDGDPLQALEDPCGRSLPMRS